MNSLSVIGRLGRDPETKYLPDDKAVCTFSLAVNRRGGKKEKEPPMWLQIAAFGKLAEICQQYLKKGRQVAVTGSIDINEYTNRARRSKNVRERGGNTSRFSQQQRRTIETGERSAEGADSARRGDR